MYSTWRGSEKSWNSEFSDSELNDAAQPLEHPPSWIERKCGRKERPADANLRRRCPTDDSTTCDDDDSPTDDSTTYDDDYECCTTYYGCPIDGGDAR